MTRPLLRLGVFCAAAGLCAACAAAETARILWTRNICVEKGRYLGWPTATKLPSGEILVAFSGDRSRHICPWGREELIRSSDGGETWTKPEVVENGPLDDRDPGLVVLKDGRLMMTWMTSVAFADPVYCKSDDYRRHLEKLPPALVKASLGNFCKVSDDGGRTWSVPVRMKTGTPHGVIPTADGRLVGLGRNLTEPGVGQDLVCQESSDGGRTWSVIGSCRTPEGISSGNLYEPHTVEVSPGRLLGLWRYRDGEKCLMQTESDDGGRTWSVLRESTLDGFPPHLLKLSDGRLLASFGRRRKGDDGEFVALSSDGGRTWGRELVIVRHAGDDDNCGYPTTVELGGGEFLTVFYRLCPEAKTSIAATKWLLTENEQEVLK